MKLLYTLLIVFASAQLTNAQNMVSVTNASAPAVCDGSAHFDQWTSYSNQSMYTWWWIQQDSTEIFGADTLIENLCTGNYSLVIDSLGYQSYYSFAIENPCSGFTQNISAVYPQVGTCTGSVTSTVSGGYPPYTYSWSNGVTTPDQYNLCPDVYYLTFADSYGCSVTWNLTMYETGYVIDPNIMVNNDDSNNCSGSASVAPTGGIGLFNVVWSTGETTTSISDLCAGIYSVSIYGVPSDSTTITFAVTDSSSTYGNNPFLDSIPVNDPYSYLVENCTIDYNAIDSASLANAAYDSTSQSLYLTWEIYDANGILIATINDTIGAYAPGVYSLNVTVYCPAKSGEQYFTIVGAIYLNAENTLSTGQDELSLLTPYPNPFTNALSIQNANGSDCSITLIDATGRIVTTERSDAEIIQLNNLSNLNAGTYFLNISTEKGNKTWKLVK